MKQAYLTVLWGLSNATTSQGCCEKVNNMWNDRCSAKHLELRNYYHDCIFLLLESVNLSLLTLLGNIIRAAPGTPMILIRFFSSNGWYKEIHLVGRKILCHWKEIPKCLRTTAVKKVKHKFLREPRQPFLHDHNAAIMRLCFGPITGILLYYEFFWPVQIGFPLVKLLLSMLYALSSNRRVKQLRQWFSPKLLM